MTQLTPIEFNAFSLYVKFDFRKAQEMLEKCTTVLENDFFLRNYTEQVRGHFVALKHIVKILFYVRILVITGFKRNKTNEMTPR